MRGDPDSCGVWAPALRHANGLFHLIYTDLKRYGRTSGAGGAPAHRCATSTTTSSPPPSIEGPWSDPVFLNASGFDPSLFQDDDGRLYILNQLWDHRPGANRFAGIVLQEYDPAQRRLVGERALIFKGTPLGLTEAPHIHKRQGWYYLLTAEGGTGWGHAATLARSRHLLGPYELHPGGPLVTARDRPDAVLQRAGHADWVETQAGETYSSISAAARCATAAAARWGASRRSRSWSGATTAGPGWTAAAGAGAERRRAGAACPPVPTHARARGFRRRRIADRLPMAAHPVSGRAVQPRRPPRPPAALRPRDHRQPVPPSAGRAAPAGALLHRAHGDGLPARALPAIGRAGLLL